MKNEKKEHERSKVEDGRGRESDLLLAKKVKKVVERRERKVRSAGRKEGKELTLDLRL